MKAFHLKTAILAVAISALGYWGCSKDSTTLQATTDNVTTAQKGEIAPNSDEIKAKIDAFDKTLTALQNGENTDFTLTTDDAVWDIEALLNSKYGWGNFSYATSSEEKLKIPIDAAKERFNSTEIVELYNQAYGQLRDHYRRLEGEKERQLILADIDIVKEEKGIFFTVTSVYGTSQEASAESRADDDYNALGDGYTVAECPGKPISPTLLKNNINLTRTLPPNHVYFSSIEAVFTNGTNWMNPSGPTTGQRRRTLLYSTSTHDFNNVPLGLPWFTCYSTADHNWYLQNWKDVINTLKPANKILSHCNIKTFGLFYIIMGTNQKKSTWTHGGELYYGSSIQTACCPPPAG
jgi:hypothetical protein